MYEDPSVMNFVDPPNATLFLGSGFSASALNSISKKPPNGTGLREHFLDALRLPKSTRYELQVLTDEFAERDSQLLYDELHRIFRIRSLADAQNKILSESWKRIYTTNYDDCVELYRISNSKRVETFDITDAVPNRLADGACIHLHGSIRNVTTDNVLTNIVLGESGYVRNLVQKSRWYDQFQRDMRLSSMVLVVGYSMFDHHIASLFLADPSLSQKTFFIQGTDFDPIFVRRTQAYGTPLFIGLDKFASALQALPRPQPVTDLSSFKSLRITGSIADRKTVTQPTAGEIHDFLVYGKFTIAKLARSAHSNMLAISRATKLLEAVEALANKKSLVVDGRLGNGKTIFLHMLAIDLTERGYKCLTLRPGSNGLPAELEALAKLDKLIVFVDRFAESQDLVSLIAERLPDAKFVFELRTAILEVRLHEIVSVVPLPYGRVTLNSLERNEIQALLRLARSAGVVRTVEKGRNHKELRDFLLGLFENAEIQQQIRNVLAPLFASSAKRSLLVASMLVSSKQIHVPPSFYTTVTESDPFAEFKPVEEVASEVFELTSDNFQARSSVLSEFVVDTLIEPKELADSIVSITLASAERKQERTFRVLMSSMMAYSNLRRELRRRSDALMTIIGIYERLRHDTRINDEPLFWLQYAIALSDVPRLDTAWEYIQTAYTEAASRKGFETYQIDTQACRIALLSAVAEGSGVPVSFLQQILDNLHLVERMISEESHRTYAIRVLEHVKPFVTARGRDLSTSEKNALVLYLNQVSRSLALLPAEFRATSGSDTVKRDIDASINLLL